ncbi:MAG TPA: hypothetical protein VFW21_15340 [Mycobacterium sp.]|nr:hypothetical protein [Mycobacterium sp.]
MSKTGSTSCPLGAYVVLEGKGSGLIAFYWPSGTFQTSVDHGEDIYTTEENTMRRSTSWKISSTGGLLDDPGTYAWCEPYLAPAP